jgi:hypothetical protein
LDEEGGYLEQQDAMRSTSKLRLPRNWLRTGIRPSGRQNAVFFV